MQDLIIKAETPEVANTTKLFLTTYKEQVSGFLNQVLGAQGMAVDAGVKVENDELVIYQMNPDKGFVLGEITQDLPMETPIKLMNYSELPVGNRYVNIDGDRIYLFIKEVQGVPDPKIGAFKSLNDAVTEFNSDSVKEALKQFKEKIAAQAKIQAKQEGRLKRLGKIPAINADSEMSQGDYIPDTATQTEIISEEEFMKMYGKAESTTGVDNKLID